MRANPHGHKDFRLQGTVLVACVGHGRRFSSLALRFGVSQKRLGLGQRSELLWRSAHDPNWLAAPLHHDLFAGFECRNINFDCRSGSFGFLGRRKGTHEWNGYCASSDSASASGCNHPSALGLVHVTHGFPQFLGVLGTTPDCTGAEVAFSSNTC